MIFVPGKITLFFIFVTFVLYSQYSTNKFKKSSKLPLRRLFGLEAIEEAVGRATELGRPAHFTFGSGALDAQCFAGFEILGYLATKTAQYGTPLIVSNIFPEVQPMTEEIVKQAYTAVGRPDLYKPENIRFLGSGSYNAAVIGIIERERVAANIMVGSFFYESILFIEAGARSGAIQIGGTMNTHQLPFMAAGCDYTLIGGEMFAAGAYLSKNPNQIGTLMGEELWKMIGVVLMIVGALLRTANVTFLADLLKK